MSNDGWSFWDDYEERNSEPGEKPVKSSATLTPSTSPQVSNIGCGDNSCIFSGIRKKGGQHTNGGCRCFKELERWLPDENRWNREEVNKIRQDVQRLANELYKTSTQVRAVRKLCEDKLAFGDGDSDLLEEVIQVIEGVKT